MRDILPALCLAVFGLAFLSVATVMPRAGEPAVVIFTDPLSDQERFVRTSILGGTVIDVPADGHVIYATFDTLPATDIALRHGVMVMLNAAGARGCAGRTT